VNPGVISRVAGGTGSAEEQNSDDECIAKFSSDE